MSKIVSNAAQVLAAIHGPKVAENRSQALHDRAIVKCEYAEAAFSTGENCLNPARSSAIHVW